MKTFKSLLSESIIGEELFDIFEGEFYEDDSLMEGVFSGIPKKIIKTMTSNYGVDQKAGENSPHTTIPVKNKSTTHKAVSDGLSNGNHVVVTKHGKVLASIHPQTAYKGERQAMTVHGSEGDGERVGQNETKYIRGKFRGGRYEKDTVHKYVRFDHTKGESLNFVHNAIEANGGHDGVEVHHIGADDNRRNLATARQANRGEYVGSKGSTHTDRRGKASDPKSLAAGTARAAAKMADKYSGGAESPHGKAKAIHAELGKAIEAGDHQKVASLSGDLYNHVRNAGLGKDAHNVERVKSAGADVGETSNRKSYTYHTADFIRRLRSLKDSSKA